MVTLSSKIETVTVQSVQEIFSKYFGDYRAALQPLSGQ